MNPNQLAFIYPFKHSDANDQELELSMLSIARFFLGIPKFIIIGDKPNFEICKFNAVHIGHGFAKEALKDALRKFKMAAFSKYTPSEFVWMNDDIYAIRPFRKEFFEKTYYTHVRKYRDWKVDSGYKWGAWKKNTMKELGVSKIHDTATHMPRLMQKDLCAKVFKRLSVNARFDFQLAYDQLFTKSFSPIAEAGVFKRIGVVSDTEVIEKYLGNYVFFNHNSAGFTDSMVEFLRSRIMKKEKFTDVEFAARPIKNRPQKAGLILQQPRVATSIYEKCCHKGEDTGQFVTCGTCPATRKQTPIFECSVHGLATRHLARTPHPEHGRPVDCVSCHAEKMGFKKKEA